jgi:hypothetical protein
MEYLSQQKSPRGSKVKAHSALLGLASVAFALGLAACSSSPSTSTGSTGGSSNTSVTTTTTASSTSPTSVSPTTACTIPQNNGGDHDADNNGGPDDGDGCDK